ncbi:MAG: cytochrome C oxidase subunit IV family protein [Bacteroidales bacterium]|nr:cytochrome C oxidase subunit IV family protein [Bacteroidales bacterium]
MSEEKLHISSYRSHLFVLAGLLLLTAASVAVTNLEMGPLNTLVAMLIAGTKAAIVLTWFMHLKFDNKLYAIFTTLVFVIFLLVLYVTFFDYSYR